MTTRTAPESGLEGVVAARTRLSEVDGAAGRLTLAGYPIDALAPKATFEDVAYLLEHDHLPSVQERETFCDRVRSARSLPAQAVDALRHAVECDSSPMAALRLGLSVVGLEDPPPERVLATMPTIVATYDRLRRGLEPRDPPAELGLVDGMLALLHDRPPDPAQTRGLSTYLCTVADHGLNASTFTARVIASTGASLAAAIEGAIGALEGPLHGGAPGPALDALLELRRRGGDLGEQTRRWVEEQVAAGERIMGFGHRVYKVRDPRADVLGAAARELLEGTGLYEDARVHEAAVLETLDRLKPGRKLQTNVEFYTALLLHGLKLPTDLFTPVFAVGRTAGWIAHVTEQRRGGRLIRPSSEYIGARGRELPLSA